ncbi:MAG: GNAT family N-acetyltransferase [Bacteroidia bacterium]|nr:GNAT family N-acetyltransferase [Bacteroidia bacterium]
MFISERLLFEQIGPQHKASYTALLMDASVMKYITGTPMQLTDATRRFDEILSINASRPEAGFFGVHDLVSRKFFGMGKLELKPANRAELGYALLQPYWGQGLATEITDTLIQHAQTIPDLISLFAIASPENRGSLHVLTKTGFTFSRAFEYHGQDAVEYVLGL